MKVIHKNLKNGELKVQVSCLDDLWYLSHVIDPKDLVSGKSFRKMKLGSADKVVKKSVFLKVEVERVEFHKHSNTLRVMGVVREGTEEVPHGAHHTLDLEEGTIITIQKNKWLKFQLDKINEACKGHVSDVLIMVMDREEASFALMKKYGFDMLSELKGNVQKKDSPEKVKNTFYVDIAKQLKEYADRLKINKIIVASPAFWKEDLMKVLKKDFSVIAKKVTLATCNNTGEVGVEEVLKRDEVKGVLRDERTAYEIEMVEKLLSEISKEGLEAYGLKAVKEAAEAGAIVTLLLTDKFIQKSREDGKYDILDQIMQLVDKAKGEILIVSIDHDGGKKLKGLGSIGAILRYKLH